MAALQRVPPFLHPRTRNYGTSRNGGPASAQAFSLLRSFLTIFSSRFLAFSALRWRAWIFLRRESDMVGILISFGVLTPYGVKVRRSIAGPFHLCKTGEASHRRGGDRRPHPRAVATASRAFRGRGGSPQFSPKVIPSCASPWIAPLTHLRQAAARLAARGACCDRLDGGHCVTRV